MSGRWSRSRAYRYKARSFWATGIDTMLPSCLCPEVVVAETPRRRRAPFVAARYRYGRERSDS